MKIRFTLILLVLSLLGATAQEAKKVFGKVSDGKYVIENVTISVVDKDISTFTDKDGKYEINAEVGDKLQYSFTGMKTLIIKVEDVTRILNTVMIPDVTDLEEVEVIASQRRSQKDLAEDYNTNKRIIRTAWGFLDADRAAGTIRMVSEEEIMPVNLCVLNVISNRFPGVKVFGNCQGGGGVLIRGASSIANVRPAAFDVDGQIFEDAPTWIDINQIKRIAILSNLALTASYGNIGVGGVVVINTVNGIPRSNEIVDRARLKNNYADGLELSSAEIAKNAPTYLTDLRASSSFEEAKTVFESYVNTYSNSPYFVLDAYSYFITEYNETNYADGILKEYFKGYQNNAVLMKALAYLYESQQRFDKANEAYKEIFILRPNYVQSYMDMANSYRNKKQPKQAAAMYARYNYLVNEGFLEQDTIGFGPIISREFNNLLMLDKNAVVDGKKANKLFVAEEDFKGTRLVFEWNDGEAEFDLQFVNPENQYYKWQHSLEHSAEEINREKDFGYNVKEYLVDGSLPGTWQVNINYLGNKSLTPTYLKATIYYNYGSKSQRREVKVFKLDVKNVNQKLFSLQSKGSI